MGSLHLFDNCFIFFSLCLVYSVLKIHPLYRYVCRNLDNIHSVNVAELFFFRKSCTCHAALFLKLIKQVLESDRRQCLALPAHLHVFLRLDRLMKPVRITAPRHDTSGELIHDHNFTFRRHHVILILEHQIVGTKRKDDIMLDF